MCTECLSESFEWITAAGTGHIESWVVLHQRSQPGSVAPEPRIVATVELTEGPWMVSALQGIASSDVTGGMPVVVAFDRPDNSEPIPVFRPANTA